MLCKILDFFNTRERVSPPGYLTSKCSGAKCLQCKSWQRCYAYSLILLLQFTQTAAGLLPASAAAAPASPYKQRAAAGHSLPAAPDAHSTSQAALLTSVLPCFSGFGCSYFHLKPCAAPQSPPCRTDTVPGERGWGTATVMVVSCRGNPSVPSPGGSRASVAILWRQLVGWRWGATLGIGSPHL